MQAACSGACIFKQIAVAWDLEQGAWTTTGETHAEGQGAVPDAGAPGAGPDASAAGGFFLPSPPWRDPAPAVGRTGADTATPSASAASAGAAAAAAAAVARAGAPTREHSGRARPAALEGPRTVCVPAGVHRLVF